MKKMHVVWIIVSVLIILSIVGFFVFKFLNVENDDWIYSSGEEQEEMLFGDVPEDYWANEYISYLTQREIMFSSGDGNFYPDKKVSYGEFIEILLRASMGRIDYENLSSDDYIKILEQNNIFKENEVSVERFNFDIRKCDVAILLAKIDIKVRNKKQVLNYLNYIDLKDLDDISQTLIAHSVSKGYFNENKGNNFYPYKVLTRAEIAEIIYLFLNK